MTCGSRDAPLWAYLLFGWLLARGCLRDHPSLEVEDPFRTTRSGSTPTLTVWNPRELRRLPGIGPRRAVEISRTRWRGRDGAGPILLSDVFGIGPSIEAEVRAWLESRDLVPACERAPADAVEILCRHLLAARPVGGGERVEARRRVP